MAWWLGQIGECHCLLALEICSFHVCPGCLGGSKTDPAQDFLFSWSLNNITNTQIKCQAHMCSHAAGPGQGPRSTEAQWVVSAAQRREPLPSSSSHSGDSRSQSPLKCEGPGWQREDTTCYPYWHLWPSRYQLLWRCDRTCSSGASRGTLLFPWTTRSRTASGIH